MKKITSQLIIIVLLLGIVSLIGYDAKKTLDIANVSASFEAIPEGITQSVIDIWNAKQASIGTGTTAQYLRGDVSWQTLPISNYKAYDAILTQSGTSAPSVTTGQNDFGATTFTWSYVSAGTYKVTASTAVFTANKTTVVIGDPGNSLVNYTATVNSTTQVTITTSALSVLSLILNAAVTNSLLTNTLVEIRVFN